MSASTRCAKETASQYVLWLVVKDGLNNDRAVVLCHAAKCVGRLDLWKYYSLYGGMWILFCRAGHYPCVQNLLWSIRRRNPPSNAEENLRAWLVVIEPWFTGY